MPSVTKTFGTLDIQVNDYKQEKIIITGFEATLYLGRLIPDSASQERGVLTMHANIHNAKMIEMVMSMYPLEIINKRRWKELLTDLSELESIGEKIKKLEFVEPNSSRFIGELRPFQKQALDFMNKTKGNCLLADEMGLGKTIETLGFLSNTTDAYPVVVIAPLVTLRNWESEIKKFLQLEQPDGLFAGQFSEPRTVVIRSGKLKGYPDADFYIINYDLIPKQVDNLIRLNPRTLVLDEIQNLRSMDTYKFKAVDEIAKTPSMKYRIGLSGTPIYNRGSEVWGMVDIIQKGYLGSYRDFLRTYCYGWGERYYVEADKQQMLSQVLRKQVLLRRKKKDVLKDLPDKVRYQQVLQIDEEYYEAEITKIFAKVQDAKEAVNSMQFGTAEQKKAKIFELNAESRSSLQQERQIAGISKAPYIVDYVKELLTNIEDEKIVIFVHHIKVHEIIWDGLYEFHPVRIKGGQTDRERFGAIQSFQNDPNCRVIICGIRAGNVGINLTAGTYVIFGELDWSPAVHKQGEDRLHRIGQKKTVIAHYLIGEGTMDERIANILTDKALEIDAVMGDKKEILDNTKALQILEHLHSKIKNKKSVLTKLVSQEQI